MTESRLDSKYRRRYQVLTWIWSFGAATLLLMPGGNLPGRGLPEAVATAVELGVHFGLFLGLAYVLYLRYVTALL